MSLGAVWSQSHSSFPIYPDSCAVLEVKFQHIQSPSPGLAFSSGVILVVMATGPRTPETGRRINGSAG